MKSTDKNPCCPGATFTRGQNDTYWCGNCGKPFKDPTEPENKIKLPFQQQYVCPPIHALSNCVEINNKGCSLCIYEWLNAEANRQHDELCKELRDKLLKKIRWECECAGDVKCGYPDKCKEYHCIRIQGMIIKLFKGVSHD